MKKHHRIIAATLSLLFLMCGCNTEPEDKGKTEDVGDYRVYVVETMNNYERSQDLYSVYDKIYISAAKGETEGGQFIIKADYNVREYNFTVSNLTNDSYTISAENITVCTELYSYCSYRRYGGYLDEGEYPDALIPIEYIVAKGENTLEKNLNQAFWVDISVPRNAQAGNYSGNITADFDGVKKQIPILLTVYDFTISEVPACESSFGIWKELADFLFMGEQDASWDKYITYYDFLLNYNLNAALPAENPDMFIKYVREYYDKITSFRINVPYDLQTGYDMDAFYSMLYNMVSSSLSDGKNYFQKAYYNFAQKYDEASSTEKIDEMSAIADEYEEKVIEDMETEGYDLSDELKESIRSLRHCITIDKKINIEGSSVNFTCPKSTMIMYTAQNQLYTQMKEDGYKIWNYTCIGGDYYPYFSMELNDYLVSTRDWLWSNWLNGYEGILYWCVNGYANWRSKLDDGYAIIPDLYHTASHDGATNGDGYLFYPGVGYDSDKPFASLRLTAIRDGIDDYTYMDQLNNLYKNISDVWGENCSADSFIGYLASDILGRSSSKLTPKGTLFARDSLANAIVAASKYGFIISDVKIENGKFIYEFRTEDSVSVKIDGSVLVPNIENGVKIYSGNLACTADAITLTVGDVDINFKTGGIVNALDSFDSVGTAISTSDYSTVSLNTDTDYSVDGNSLKINLNGHVYSSSSATNTFMPSVNFNLLQNIRVADIEKIEFYLFNTYSEDLEITLYFIYDDNGFDSIQIYDIIRFKSNSKTKVSIDNIGVLCWSDSLLNRIKGIGLRTDNLIKNGEAYGVTLYIDEMGYQLKGA